MNWNSLTSFKSLLSFVHLDGRIYLLRHSSPLTGSIFPKLDHFCCDSIIPLFLFSMMYRRLVLAERTVAMIGVIGGVYMLEWKLCVFRQVNHCEGKFCRSLLKSKNVPGIANLALKAGKSSSVPFAPRRSLINKMPRSAHFRK